MPIQQTRNPNLRKPFTQAEAKYFGRLGGLKKSEKKTRAVRLNGLKEGIFAKNPDVIRLITPTPAQKIAGVTKRDVIDFRKLHIKGVFSKTEQEWFDTAEDCVATMEEEMLFDYQEGKLKNRTYWNLQLLDRKIKINELKYRLKQTNMLQQVNIGNEQKILTVTDVFGAREDNI